MKSIFKTYCFVFTVSIIVSTVLFAAGDRAKGDILVGAYYYPWYKSGFKFAGIPVEQSNWDSAVRCHLTPEQTPKLGLYDSDKPSVISDHIAQSIRGGIDFWAISWWGPKSNSDNIFRDKILTNPDASKLKYAVFYESTGRLGSLLQPGYINFLPDIKYVAENYFDNPNYLRIDGRPVIFIYLSREYFRSKADDQLIKLRKMYPDIYIVGDDVFGEYYRAQYALQFDAVTSCDVYGQSLKVEGPTQDAVKLLAKIYSQAQSAANTVGTGFVPAVTPGYNDRAVRKGNIPIARYFRGVADSKEGDIFRAMLKDAGLPFVDPRAGNMLMVTSFNEWLEDTQIEATSAGSAPTAQDDSGSHSHYTKNYIYTDYGYLYLDILAEMTSEK